MTSGSGLPPCERFTVLDSRQVARAQCDVCDQLESDHASPGQRTLSGGEIEELRRRMLVEFYEQREEKQRRQGGDGSSER
jgi:hypothetical protein